MLWSEDRWLNIGKKERGHSFWFYLNQAQRPPDGRRLWRAWVRVWLGGTPVWPWTKRTSVGMIYMYVMLLRYVFIMRASIVPLNWEFPFARKLPVREGEGKNLLPPYQSHLIILTTTHAISWAHLENTNCPILFTFANRCPKLYTNVIFFKASVALHFWLLSCT